MSISRVLEDDHYKPMPGVTLDVTRSRTLNAQWPWEPSKGQNCSPLPAMVRSPHEWKNYRVGRKTPFVNNFLKIPLYAIDTTFLFCQEIKALIKHWLEGWKLEVVLIYQLKVCVRFRTLIWAALYTYRDLHLQLYAMPLCPSPFPIAS